MNFAYHRTNPIGLIIVTVLLALLLMLLPLPTWAQVLRPQWLLLVLIYWCLFLPGSAGLSLAWVSGLLLDILQNTTLGEHALIFTAVSYFVLRFQTRINFFPFWQKSAVILGLISTNHIFQVWLGGVLGHPVHNNLYWLSIGTTLLFWPWVSLLIQQCQRKFGSR